jgi:hypothetical protein
MSSKAPRTTPKPSGWKPSAEARDLEANAQRATSATASHGLPPRPRLLRPRDVLHLQRTIGNQAVGRLLRREGEQRPDAGAARAPPAPQAGAPIRESRGQGTGEAGIGHDALPLPAGIQACRDLIQRVVAIAYNAGAPPVTTASATITFADLGTGTGPGVAAALIPSHAHALGVAVGAGHP